MLGTVEVKKSDPLGRQEIAKFAASGSRVARSGELRVF